MPRRRRAASTSIRATHATGPKTHVQQTPAATPPPPPSLYRKHDFLAIDLDPPALVVPNRLADIGVVHPPVAGGAEHDQVIRPQAHRRRVLRQVEEVVDLAVSLPVSLPKPLVPAEL